MVCRLLLERLHKGAAHPDPDLCHGRSEQAVRLTVRRVQKPCKSGGRVCRAVRACRSGGYRCAGRSEHCHGCKPHPAGDLPDRDAGGRSGQLYLHQQECIQQCQVHLGRYRGLYVLHFRGSAACLRRFSAGICQHHQWANRSLQFRCVALGRQN